MTKYVNRETQYLINLCILLLANEFVQICYILPQIVYYLCCYLKTFCYLCSYLKTFCYLCCYLKTLFMLLFKNFLLFMLLSKNTTYKRIHIAIIIHIFLYLIFSNLS